MLHSRKRYKTSKVCLSVSLCRGNCVCFNECIFEYCRQWLVCRKKFQVCPLLGGLMIFGFTKKCRNVCIIVLQDSIFLTEKDINSTRYRMAWWIFGATSWGRNVYMYSVYHCSTCIWLEFRERSFGCKLLCVVVS